MDSHASGSPEISMLVSEVCRRVNTCCNPETDTRGSNYTMLLRELGEGTSHLLG